jgi:hypothetical protein
MFGLKCSNNCDQANTEWSEGMHQKLQPIWQEDTRI